MSLVKPVGKVQWAASVAADVVGYKVFWTVDGSQPSYESSFIDVIGVTEVQLPFAGLEAFEGVLQVSVAAFDSVGNVSDLTPVITVPLDVVAPDAPSGVEYVAA